MMIILSSESSASWRSFSNFKAFRPSAAKPTRAPWAKTRTRPGSAKDWHVSNVNWLLACTEKWRINRLKNCGLGVKTQMIHTHQCISTWKYLKVKKHLAPQAPREASSSFVFSGAAGADGADGAGALAFGASLGSLGTDLSAGDSHKSQGPEGPEGPQGPEGAWKAIWVANSIQNSLWMQGSSMTKSYRSGAEWGKNKSTVWWLELNNATPSMKSLPNSCSVIPGYIMGHTSTGPIWPIVWLVPQTTSKLVLYSHLYPTWSGNIYIDR